MNKRASHYMLGAKDADGAAHGLSHERRMTYVEFFFQFFFQAGIGVSMHMRLFLGEFLTRCI
jgi:hypothetical protein